MTYRGMKPVTGNLGEQLAARATRINIVARAIGAFMREADHLNLRDPAAEAALAVRIVEELEGYDGH